MQLKCAFAFWVFASHCAKNGTLQTTMIIMMGMRMHKETAASLVIEATPPLVSDC